MKKLFVVLISIIAICFFSNSYSANAVTIDCSGDMSTVCFKIKGIAPILVYGSEKIIRPV